MSQKQVPVLRRVMAFIKPYISYLYAALVSAVLSVSLTLYAPVLIGRGIDFVLGPGRVDFTGMAPILLLLAGVVLCAAFFQWIMTLCTNRIAYQTVREIRVALFDKLQQLPLSGIDSRPYGDIMGRMINDVESVSDGLLQGFSQLFTGIVTIIATLGYMLTINASIALVVVVVTPLSLFVASFIAKKSFHLFREQSAVRGEIGSFVEEMVGGQKVVKAFAHEEAVQKQFEEINRRLYVSGVSSQFYSSITNPCTRFVNGIVYACVGIFGAFGVISGGLSVGQLTCFLTYANQYTKPFNEISGVITELQTALASARRIFEILDLEIESKEGQMLEHIHACNGEVEICNVDFAYQPHKKIIDNLSVSIKPGERIAIVGPTGCGKTTLINLLMRFYDVDNGKIQVDGIDIRNIPRHELRSMYGMVLQDTWLLRGTVRDNICYGRPDASEEEMISAAKSAYAHRFICRLANGYDTVISEDGGNLSSGQKQLLCIARVMLTNPPMLILDEATSSIDTRTELHIQKALNTMMQGRTSFIVAHRLSTIKEADRILVLKDGHLIEEGSHNRLMAQGGFYYRLFQAQFQGEDEQRECS